MNRLKCLRRARRDRIVPIMGIPYRVIVHEGRLMMKTDARDWAEKACILDHDDRTITVTGDVDRKEQERSIREAIEMGRRQLLTGGHCRPIRGWHYPDEPESKRTTANSPPPVKAESREVAVAKRHFAVVPIVDQDYCIAEAAERITENGERRDCQINHASRTIWISPDLSQHRFCLVTTYAIARAYKERAEAKFQELYAQELRRQRRGAK